MNGIEKENFRVILIEDYCSPIYREGFDGDVNPYVFLKPLIKVWDILIHGYDARNTIIVDDTKERLVCNEEGNRIITKNYTCHNANDTFLSHCLWPCLLHLKGVSDVRPTVKTMEPDC